VSSRDCDSLGETTVLKIFPKKIKNLQKNKKLSQKKFSQKNEI
jgi:hypothetical protein